MVPSPAHFSCGSTLKNCHFYQISKTFKYDSKRYRSHKWDGYGTFWGLKHLVLPPIIWKIPKPLKIGKFWKAKIGEFATARSSHVIALCLWNCTHISISPTSTPYFNPIENWFNLTHFWDSPKTPISRSKGTSTRKIGWIFPKFHLSKISNLGAVYGGNDVF